MTRLLEVTNFSHTNPDKEWPVFSEKVLFAVATGSAETGMTVSVKRSLERAV
jgi:hypothetical protein